MDRFLRLAHARLLMALALNVVLGLTGVHVAHAAGEDGYDLWLRYRPLPAAQRTALAAAATGITAPDDTPTVRAATAELKRGLAGMLAFSLFANRIRLDRVDADDLVLGL